MSADLSPRSATQEPEIPWQIQVFDTVVVSTLFCSITFTVRECRVPLLISKWLSPYFSQSVAIFLSYLIPSAITLLIVCLVSAFLRIVIRTIWRRCRTQNSVAEVRRA